MLGLENKEITKTVFLTFLLHHFFYSYLFICNLNNFISVSNTIKQKSLYRWAHLKKKGKKTFNKIKTIDLITIFDLKLRKH